MPFDPRSMLMVPVLVALSCFAVTEAAARDAGGSTQALIRRLDPDRDGTLDRAEVKRAAAAKFRALDRRHTGRLSARQLAGILTPREFRGANPYRDGTIELREYLALADRRFREANPDRDGTIEAVELHTRAGRALTRLIR